MFCTEVWRGQNRRNPVLAEHDPTSRVIILSSIWALYVNIIKLSEQSQTKRHSDAIPKNICITELSRHAYQVSWREYTELFDKFLAVFCYLARTFFALVTDWYTTIFNSNAFGKALSREFHLKLFQCCFITLRLPLKLIEVGTDINITTTLFVLIFASLS